jgi:hypothetical protein
MIEEWITSSFYGMRPLSNSHAPILYLNKCVPSPSPHEKKLI